MGTIRILLALAVVFAHTDAPFGALSIGGELAVQGFFIVSGYYMALILSEKYVGRSAVKTFWINRALKIYPAYWLVLLVTVAYTLFMYVTTSAVSGRNLGPYLTPFHFVFTSGATIGNAELMAIAFAQLTLFPLDGLLFLQATGNFFIFTHRFSTDVHPLWLSMFVPPAWTLALEIYFYIAAPFLINLRLRWLVGLLFLSVCVRLYIYHAISWQYDPWTYRFFLNELAFFLVGFIGYKILAIANRRLPRSSESIIAWSLLLLTITQLLFFSFFAESFRSYLLLVTLACAVPYVARLSSGWKWDRMLGELSYPIYIVHFLLLIIVRDQIPSLVDSKTYGLTMALFSIVCALVIKMSLMDRIEKRRRANSEKLIASS
jgi:peptidoglycan/LPS O-acetylase OafA/YrhL